MDIIEITETRFKNTLFDKEFSDFMYENRVKINGKKRKKKDFFLDLSFAEINDFYTFNEYVIKILDHLNLDINTDKIKLIIGYNHGAIGPSGKTLTATYTYEWRE